MQEAYWGLLWGTTRKCDWSNTEQIKKVGYDAVVTGGSDNPAGSLPSGMALQSFYVFEGRNENFLSCIYQLPWRLPLGRRLTLGQYSLWPRLIAGKRLIRDLWTTNIPSSGKNECFSLEEDFRAVQHLIYSNEMPNFWYNICNVSCEWWFTSVSYIREPWNHSSKLYSL